MKNNNYYIIAFNKDKPSIINIDNTILKEKDTNKLINIAFIDLITSKYDEDTFRNHLLNKHFIDDYETPIFIARKTTGESIEFPYTRHIIHYFSLIFKSDYSKYIKNIALTTTRNRLINNSDAGVLIKDFEKLYYSDNELYDIANEILDKDTIEKIFYYSYNTEKYETSPINYLMIRNIVASLTEWDKYKTFEKYYMETYGREKYNSDVAALIPADIIVKVEPVRDYTQQELEQIKNDVWDNLEAQKRIENGKYDPKETNTLTLEDRLRSGLSNEMDYESRRKRSELEFREIGKKSKK